MENSKIDQRFSLPQDFDQTMMSASSVALLCSGGVESAILAGTLVQHFSQVFPIYVRFGLRWEEVELAHLNQYLSVIAQERLATLTVLDEPVKDVYKTHWSTTGDHVPDASTPDSAVFLPGRNILLLSKASVWCAMNNVRIIALGSLSTNPFPDATDSFFQNFEHALSDGLQMPLRLIRPVSNMHKTDVIKLGAKLPLHLSFSCIQPDCTTSPALHCGACNKCGERRQAFLEAGVKDDTKYATQTPIPQRQTESDLCIR